MFLSHEPLRCSVEPLVVVLAHEIYETMRQDILCCLLNRLRGLDVGEGFTPSGRRGIETHSPRQGLRFANRISCCDDDGTMNVANTSGLSLVENVSWYSENGRKRRTLLKTL